MGSRAPQTITFDDASPAWATETNHWDPHTTEYWRSIRAVRSSDANSTLVVGLVQNGPRAPIQVLAGGMRFTLAEGAELAAAVAEALALGSAAAE